MEWSESGNLVGGQRLDLQSVDREGEQIADAGQHLLMALESRNSGKRVRHDQQRKVPGATGRAGVPNVIGAVVLDFQGSRRQVSQPFPQPVRTLDGLHLATMDFLRAHGQTLQLASYDQRLMTAAAALGFTLAAVDP